MRILYFSRDYTPHDYRFLSSLANTNHEVFYLKLERGQRQMEDRSLPENITQIPWVGSARSFQWKNVLKYLSDLKRVIREVRPEIIHAGPVQKCAFLAALTGFKPLVTMSWGSDLLKESDKNIFFNWITRFTLKRTTVLIGDCKAVQQKAESFGFSNENTILFPWGINLDEFSPSENNLFRERRGWKNNFVILSLRSWEPIYGVDVLANAFTMAVAEEPSLRLILLGNGSQAKVIRSIFEKAGISEDIFWGGQVSQNDLPGFYQSADLYISASHSDGSSVSLMESLASGLPVLVSDIPGNKEWIGNQEQGWLFKDNDSIALKNGILHAFRNREDLQSMSKNARISAEKRADWNKNFKKLLEAYQFAFRLEKG